jgi:hypothetical protein
LLGRAVEARDSSSEDSSSESSSSESGEQLSDDIPPKSARYTTPQFLIPVKPTSSSAKSSKRKYDTESEVEVDPNEESSDRMIQFLPALPREKKIQPSATKGITQQELDAVNERVKNKGLHLNAGSSALSTRDSTTEPHTSPSPRPKQRAKLKRKLRPGQNESG